MSIRMICTAIGLLTLLWFLPGFAQSQEPNFTDNFSFEAKPVITTDYLRQENLKIFSPDNISALLDRGFQRMSEGKLEEALLDFESIVVKAPDHGAGYYGIGLCHKQKGDTAKAGTFFLKSISKDATFGPSYLELGDMALDSKPKAAEQKYKAAMKLMPESAEPLHRLSVIALLRKDPYNTKRYLKKALALEPDHFPSNYMQGQIWFAENHYNEAVKSFSRCLESNPDHIEIYAWRAICQYLRRNKPEAFSDLDKGLQLDPENQMLYTLRGALYYEHKEYLKAAQDFHKTFTLSPQQNSDFKPSRGLYPRTEEYKAVFSLVLNTSDDARPELQPQLARAAVALLETDYTTCQKTLKPLLTHNSQLPLYLWAMVLEKDGKTQEALKHYQQCRESSPAYLEAKKRMAMIQMDNKQYDEAYSNFREVLLKEPRFVIGNKMCGNIQSQKGNYKLAIGHYNMAIMHDSTGTDLYFNRASCYLALNRHQLALNDLDALLALKPQDGGAWELKGDAFAGLQDTATALLAYTSSLKHRYSTSVRFKRGLLLLNTHQYSEALEDFSAIRNFDDNYPAARLNSANCHIRLQDYQQALEILNTFLQQHPDNAVAYVLRGICYREQKKEKEARASFEQARTLGFEGIEYYLTD